MSNFTVLRLQRIKSLNELKGRSFHNRRIGKIPDHADLKRLEMNQTVGNAVVEFNKRAQNLKMRKNGVLAVEVVLSFSPEMKEKIDVKDWHLKSLEWIGKEFGENNVLEVSLHLDEKTPHLHVLFVPRDITGKWNWRGICTGREGMRNLQTRYGDVMKDFGLIRGKAKIGRDNVPPGIHREMERLKEEVVKTKEMEKKKRMENENNIFNLVRTYFGEDKFLNFLRWAKEKEKKEKESKKLQEELISKKDFISPAL